MNYYQVLNFNCFTVLTTGDPKTYGPACCSIVCIVEQLSHNWTDICGWDHASLWN